MTWRALLSIPAFAALFGLVPSCGGAEPRPAESAEAPVEAPKRKKKKAAPELPPMQIVTTLRGYETDLRRCFFANPRARGFVRFSWDVDEMGLVHDVKNEHSTIGDPRVEGCLAERLSELRFGQLESASSARWAFVFQLVDNPEANKKAKRGGKKKKKKKVYADDEPGVTIDPKSKGRLDPKTVDDVVEGGYPLFARCYRDGVQRNHDIQGALRLRFVVDRHGNVHSITDAGSDLSDRQVVDCVAEAFFSLRFPEPKTGDVEVVYRIHLAGGGR